MKNKELGASLIEYALMVTLILLTGVAAVQTLGTSISNGFSEVNQIVACGNGGGLGGGGCGPGGGGPGD